MSLLSFGVSLELPYSMSTPLIQILPVQLEVAL